MTIYDKLKRSHFIDYYILGIHNKNWKETFRNPFYGLKLLLGTANIDAHSIIDLRIFYKRISVYNYYISKDLSGVKQTFGTSKYIIKRKDIIFFEIKKRHAVDALYLNGLFTFSFNLTNTYFPWIAVNFRPFRNYYFNFGIGWEGTYECDKKIAEFGLKCRIASYEKESKYNPGVVAPAWWEGHI